MGGILTARGSPGKGEARAIHRGRLPDCSSGSGCHIETQAEPLIMMNLERGVLLEVSPKAQLFVAHAGRRGHPETLSQAPAVWKLGACDSVRLGPHQPNEIAARELIGAQRAADALVGVHRDHRKAQLRLVARQA